MIATFYKTILILLVLYLAYKFIKAHSEKRVRSELSHDFQIAGYVLTRQQADERLAVSKGMHEYPISWQGYDSMLPNMGFVSL